MKYKILLSTFVTTLTLVVLFWAKNQQVIETSVAPDKAAKIEGLYQQEFLMTRDPATNTIPRQRLLKAYAIAQQKRAEMAQKENAIPIYWQERGPNNIGGRTRGLLIDANDPSGRTVWAAGVAGGLWRSGNIDAASPNWNNIDDFFTNLAISTIAQDPSNPNTMYFGTGENGFGNFDAVLGFGIWKSTDAGISWNRLAASNPFNVVNKILVDNSGVVFAATNQGLRRSPDGGATWPKVLGVGFTAAGDNVQDLEISAAGEMFATINSDGIYRFKNGAWNKLTTDLPASNYGRIEVGCAPGNANVLYAMYQRGDSDTCFTFLHTTNDGDNWTPRTTPTLGGQCWYNFIIGIDPNNSNRVWAAGVGMYESDDAGVTWEGVGGIHSDHHAIVYRPGNSNDMVLGNDGGVYRCTNAAAATPTMTNRNEGYNVTQFHGHALHPTAGSNYILGGTQDNATLRFSAPGIGSTTYPSGIGGDGGYSFIDQDDPSIQIAAYINRLFFVSTDGGANFSNLTSSYAPTIFITPAAYDDAANIFYYSSSNDTLGRRASVGAAGAETFEPVAAFNNSVASAIAVSPNTANRLYVGTSNGSFVRIDNADQAGAINITPLSAPTSGYMSCIAVERGDDNHLLATFSNYGVNSVWESTNGGMNWTSIEGDLPDMPVRWALFHPFDSDKALLATEAGVWSSDNLDGGATTWWPTNNFGLANVRVEMLQIRTSDWLVSAATHGRGMYTTDYFTMLTTCPPSLFVGGAISPGIYMAEDFISSNGTIAAGEKVIFHAGEYILLTDGFHASAGSDFWALIQECGFMPKPAPVMAKKDWRSGPAASNTGIDRNSTEPDRLALICYPNPAKYELTINYQLPANGSYFLFVRNLQGQLVQTLASAEASTPGQFTQTLDARNFQAGVYLLTLQTQQGALTERFIVAK